MSSNHESIERKIGSSVAASCFDGRQDSTRLPKSSEGLS